MNPPAPHIRGGSPSAANPQTVPIPVAETFDPEQVAFMQAEMQRLMRDYPDGNIPPEKIAEWEALAAAERLGHEPEDLADAIANDEEQAHAEHAALFETPQRRRATRTRSAAPKDDRPPADMQPAEQETPDTITLNRADTKLAINVARLYSTVGVIVFTFNQTDGVILLSNAEARAKELVLLSNHHPAMKKALRNLTESNDYITFAFGHGGMILAILQAHGVMPQDIGKRVVGMFRRPQHAQPVAQE